MKISLVLTKKDGVMYDLSSLVTGIQYSTDLFGQPGKLLFSIEKNPSDLVFIMENGDSVRLEEEGQTIFVGFIFDLGRDATESYRVVCYDQMRYLRNNDILFFENKTASDIFIDVCNKAQIPFGNFKTETISDYILPDKLHKGVSYYDMIYDSIVNTIVALADTSEPFKYHYYIRDRAGILEFTELKNNKTKLLVSDDTIVTGYQYNVSIDSGVYNRIKTIVVDEKEGTIESYIAFNSKNIKKWGVLQLLIERSKEDNIAMIEELTKKRAELFAVESVKLRIPIIITDNIYEIGVPPLQAGDVVNLSLKKIGIEQEAWIQSITHYINKDLHTADMEVYISKPFDGSWDTDKGSFKY